MSANATPPVETVPAFRLFCSPTNPRKNDAKRGPGRHPKAKAAPAAASLDGVAGIVAAVQGSERQRVKMRGALERIQAVLADVLA